jgi:hypothetical protein
MAMVKLGPGFSDINGKQGGNVWRADVCGQHLQAPPRTWNHPPSESQRSRRRAFMYCVHYFFKVLTQRQIDAWWIFTSRHPQINKKGEEVFLQAHNMFIKVNINRAIAGIPLWDWPPSFMPEN